MAVGFGTSGVRGLVTELTDLECALFAVAFTRYMSERSIGKPVSLAGDLRSSTPRILRAVAHAIGRDGGSVDYCGFVPTPALAWHAMRRGQPSIMVTGSHIPDDRNGIKFYLPWGEVLKPDEQRISARYRSLREGSAHDRTLAGLHDDLAPDGRWKPDRAAELGPPTPGVADAYIERYVSWLPAQALAGLRVVLYEHSSVARDVFRQLLVQLGADVVAVGRSDTFVPVDTEAVENPEQLREWVKAHQADALVSADGDGDRPLVVDDAGAIVRGDVLGILVAGLLQADAVSAPVSCNTALEKCGRFARIDRCRIGSPYVVAAMQQAQREGCRRVVGYEANGGFLLGSDCRHASTGNVLAALPTRDAALPVVGVLSLMAGRKRRLSELVAELPARHTASGLLRGIEVETAKALIAILEEDNWRAVGRHFGAKLGELAAADVTDGLRFTFTSGDILHLRPSGNAPEFRCYTESATPDRAEENNRAALAIIGGPLLDEARRRVITVP